MDFCVYFTDYQDNIVTIILVRIIITCLIGMNTKKYSWGSWRLETKQEDKSNLWLTINSGCKSAVNRVISLKTQSVVLKNDGGLFWKGAGKWWPGNETQSLTMFHRIAYCTTWCCMCATIATNVFVSNRSGILSILLYSYFIYI